MLDDGEAMPAIPAVPVQPRQPVQAQVESATEIKAVGDALRDRLAEEMWALYKQQQ
jgi:hypothetical protein